MAGYDKPLPRGEHYHGAFYDWCKRHELRFQRCAACKRWRHARTLYANLGNEGEVRNVEQLLTEAGCAA